MSANNGDGTIFEAISKTITIVPKVIDDLKSRADFSSDEQLSEDAKALKDFKQTLGIYQAAKEPTAEQSEELFDSAANEISPLLTALMDENIEIIGMGPLNLDRPVSPTKARELNSTLKQLEQAVDELISQLSTLGEVMTVDLATVIEETLMARSSATKKRPARKRIPEKIGKTTKKAVTKTTVVTLVARKSSRGRGSNVQLSAIRVTFARKDTNIYAGFTISAEFTFDRVWDPAGIPKNRADVLQFAWDRYRIIHLPVPAAPLPAVPDLTQNLLNAPAYLFDNLRKTHPTSTDNTTTDTFTITLNDEPGWTGHGPNMPATNNMWYVFSPVWGVVDTQNHLVNPNPNIGDPIGNVLNGSIVQTQPLYISIQGIRAGGARTFHPHGPTTVDCNIATGNWIVPLPAGGPFTVLPATPLGY